MVLDNHLNKVLESLDAGMVNNGFVGIIDFDKKLYYGESLRDQVVFGDIKISEPGVLDVVNRLFESYQYTGDLKILERVKRLTKTLISVQLENGGWGYWGMTDKANINKSRSRGTDKVKHLASFDEGTTPLVLKFLISFYSEVKDKSVLESINRGIHLVKIAQNSDGGWPPYYPNNMLTYSAYSSFNDQCTTSALELLILYKQSIGDINVNNSIEQSYQFIEKTQLDNGAWGQQYNNFKPCKARGNEPAASCSTSTRDIIYSLLFLYQHSNSDSFKKQIRIRIKHAEKWLKEAEFEKGTWSRFYELTTDRPLFVDYSGKSYYDYSVVKAHKKDFMGYAFAGNLGIPNLLTDLKRWQDWGDETFFKYKTERVYSLQYAQKQLEIICKELDEKLDSKQIPYKNNEGRWYLQEHINYLSLILSGFRFNYYVK